MTSDKGNRNGRDTIKGVLPFFIWERAVIIIEKWKIVLYSAIIALLIAAIAVGIAVLLKKDEPAVVQIPSVSERNIKEAFPKSTSSEVKEIEKQIIKTQDVKAPEYHYYTITQEAGDKEARQYAAKEKADKVVKTTEEIPVKDEKGRETEQKVIENNYYGINLNRKHDIKLGAAAIDDDPYVSLSYRNRDVEYTVYKKTNGNKYGAGISVTVAKW